MSVVTQYGRSGVAPVTGCQSNGIWLLALVLLVGLLPRFSEAIGQATVTTVGGGPLSVGGSASGFADGNSVQEAQFSTPSGLVLDISGTSLFLADSANGRIRRLDLALGTTATYLSGLSTPVDVAVDSNTNLYVLTQGDGLILQFDNFGNRIATNNSTVLTSPTAMAIDTSGNLYVTETGGALKRVKISDRTVTTIVAAGTFSGPRGVEVLDTGAIAVSDTGNHVIRLVDPTSFAVTLFSGAIGVSGTNSGPATLARFNSPHGVAKAGNNVLIIADYGNHQVRVVDSTGGASTLYGVSSNSWVTVADPQILPGWADGSALTAEARLPSGLVVDGAGNVFVTEQYYHIVRRADNTGLTGASGVGSGGSGGTGGAGTVTLNPPALTISPDTGYFPLGQTITVSSSSTNVFFTTDGSTPTTNSTVVSMANGVGSIVWKNATNNLTGLRVASFLFSGTNSASTNIQGLVATTNSIGMPAGINTNIFGGIGGTVVVPVVVNLKAGDQLKSMQFRIEVTPNGAAPTISANFSAIPVTTNDFIRVVTSDQGSSAPAVFSSVPYLAGTTRGLLVSFIGTNANLSVSSFAVVSMLAIPIPGTASEGDTYSLSVLNPSGTSDGGQTVVTIGAGAAQTLLVTNRNYLVGDTSPGGWYNAGDFGDQTDGTGAGFLSNNDVNNIFLASTGVRLPYAFSDSFDAMDVFPEDAVGTVGGDGQIRFLDWQIALIRSLGLFTNIGGLNTTNWFRSWSAGGVRVNGTTNVNTLQTASLRTAALATPGNVWHRQALIGAGVVEQARSGDTVSVPVYARLTSLARLAGAQFRAVITPSGAPPLAGQVTFVPSFSGAATVTPRLNEIAVGWNVGAFSLGEGSSNLLGHLQVPLPNGINQGACYTITVTNADGAPNLTTQYEFETRAGCIWVQSASLTPVSGISDEWRQTFFAGQSAQVSADDADADTDGFSNLIEYLSGTNPTNANSILRLNDRGWSGASNRRVMELLSAPGKRYYLECKDAITNATWQRIYTNSGNGQIIQFLLTNGLDATRFYRLQVEP